ncbi:zinc finger protein 679-like [Melitaea cinxia]|uniref:zinc finger protein 679-like n=1 Tax=Melitaea cinxia TaxID=113334 RepID=UPI001E2710CF|nr:zinc finger protein 679-like [Melitaea cinxia]
MDLVWAERKKKPDEKTLGTLHIQDKKRNSVTMNDEDKPETTNRVGRNHHMLLVSNNSFEGVRGGMHFKLISISSTSERHMHQCDECGKCVTTKSNLKAHKICHTSQRPFKCEECPATFRGYSALSQHRKVHSSSQPYHCEYCSKAFRRRSGLVHHIRTHTGVVFDG